MNNTGSYKLRAMVGDNAMEDMIKTGRADSIQQSLENLHKQTLVLDQRIGQLIVRLDPILISVPFSVSDQSESDCAQREVCEVISQIQTITQIVHSVHRKISDIENGLQL